MKKIKKKIVALIQARFGASRLPAKVLYRIRGKTLLEIQLERLSKARMLDDVVLITTGSPADDKIADFCKEKDISCFRGSERDLLDRYYRAAIKYNADVVVRITADCPLIDPAVVDEMVKLFLKYPGGLDFLANTEPSPGTYPDGMDVWIFSMEALKKAWLGAEKPSEREHVSFYFYRNPKIFRCHRKDLKADLSLYRFTVDYKEDAELLEKIFKELHKRNQSGTMTELVQIMKDKPGWMKINSKYSFGEGWIPSFERDKEMKELRPRRAQPLNCKKGNAFWKRAIKVIPGGAQTFSKMPYQHVEGVAPKLLYRGIGCRVWDMDGNEFIDSVLGLGTIVLGHCNKEIDDAAAYCAKEYFNTPSLPHPLEHELASKINNIIPCSEMVRFAKNGSDVTSAAVRLARHITKKDIIACTGYHGWHDWYIGATQRCSGVPNEIRKLTKVFHYNDIDSLKAIFKAYKNNVAAVILEPVNFEPPKDNFLHKVKELCDKNKCILIFDEIVTGFRIDIGGAQRYFNVTPDLACFGKSIANGYPLSVLCGKAKYMEGFKDAFFSGTFCGEISSMAAAIKMLEIHKRENLSVHLNRLGDMLISDWNSLIKELDMPYSDAIGYGWWPKYRFYSYNGYSSLEILTLFQQELVKRGILTRATVFLSLAHQRPDIREMLLAMKKALLVVKQAVEERKLHEFLEGRIIEPVIRDENIKH